MSKDLNPDKALIFRITHRNNLPWMFANGLHCKNSKNCDPNFETIGNIELIGKRPSRIVDIPPGGTLSDYIPFYFTPFSPMMYNIHTGRGGVKQRSNDEIVILVSSLHRLAEIEISFVFSDRHAYLTAAQFSAELADLDRIDWPILQARNFRRDNPDDPGSFERYQAEALVHQHMPTDSLIGIVCYNDAVANDVERLLDEHDVQLKIVVKRNWYL